MIITKSRLDRHNELECKLDELHGDADHQRGLWPPPRVVEQLGRRTDRCWRGSGRQCGGGRCARCQHRAGILTTIHKSSTDRNLLNYHHMNFLSYKFYTQRSTINSLLYTLWVSYYFFNLLKICIYSSNVCDTTFINDGTTSINGLC